MPTSSLKSVRQPIEYYADRWPTDSLQARGNEYGTRAITNIAKVSPMPKAGGKWNTYEITARGSHLTLVLNGIKTVDVQHSQFTEGPISLQFGNGEKGAPGGAIKWRKVQIRPF